MAPIERRARSARSREATDRPNLKGTRRIRKLTCYQPPNFVSHVFAPPRRAFALLFAAAEPKKDFAIILPPIAHAPDPTTTTMVTACDVPPGVVTGDNLLKLLKHAKDNGYAIPAFNCTT